MGRNYLQGRYTPNQPKKYEGDIRKIDWRSSWELTAFKWCDRTKRVLKWSSEEVVIPYISPVDGKRHRYFVDLKFDYLMEDGSVRTFLVEIKPLAQTRPPRQAGKPENYMEKLKTYHVNQAKWEAARAYCKEVGWNFQIWTEEELIDGVKNDKDIQGKMAKNRRENREKKRVRSVVGRRAKKLAGKYYQERKKMLKRD